MFPFSNCHVLFKTICFRIRIHPRYINCDWLMSLLSFFQFIILFLICRVSVPHLILPPSHLPLLLDFIKERGCLSCSVPHSLYFADCIFMYNLVCSTHAYLSSNKLIYLLKKILIRCGVLATFKL